MFDVSDLELAGNRRFRSTREVRDDVGMPEGKRASPHRRILFFVE